MDNNTLEEMLRAITPERLGRLVELTAAQNGEKRSIGLAPIIRALTDGYDLGAAAERGLALQRLHQAIRRAVAQIPGIKYVEGES